ncbi:MAG: DNA polymerase III subunit delta' [Bauldia sp.]
MAEADEIPPLDALDGWPMPEQQPAWLGRPAAEETLLRAYAGGRMHHAWILAGPRGIGKATLAFRFARFVLANPDPTPDMATRRSLAIDTASRTFRQVAAGAHPNLLVLRRPWDDKTKRYRTQLLVDEIRRIQGFFGSTAGEGGWRIAIVDTADDLNDNAANALLKTLEEPPPRSLFILVASRPGKLLPTIRSRCRKLDLAPLDTDVIAAALAEANPGADDADIRLAAVLGNGSLRTAIQLFDGEGVETFRAFQGLAATLPEVDFAGVHALADRISARGREDAFAGFMEGLEGWLSRRVRGEPEPDGGRISELTAGASLAAWADVWEKAADSAFQAEEYNLDRKQVILQIFMALARAARM